MDEKKIYSNLLEIKELEIKIIKEKEKNNLDSHIKIKEIEERLIKKDEEIKNEKKQKNFYLQQSESRKKRLTESLNKQKELTEKGTKLEESIRGLENKLKWITIHNQLC